MKLSNTLLQAFQAADPDQKFSVKITETVERIEILSRKEILDEEANESTLFIDLDPRDKQRRWSGRETKGRRK